MRDLVVLGVVVLAVALAYFMNAGEAIVFFVLTGYIPLLNLSIPPVAMLIFWIIIVPTVIVLYKISSYTFWGFMEEVGKLHQQHINKSIRWASDQVVLRPEQFHPIITIVMLHQINKLPDSSTSIPVLSFRRRFLSVPAA